MYFYLRRLQATAVLYFIVAEFSFFAPLSNEMCLRSGFYVFLIGCNLECKLCHMSLISGRKQFLVKSSGRSSLGHFFYIFTQPPELNRNTSSSFFYIYKMSPWDKSCAISFQRHRGRTCQWSGLRNLRTLSSSPTSSSLPSPPSSSLVGTGPNWGADAKH